MQSPEGGILAHSFARIAIHVVVSTKNRRNLIPPNKLQELFAYIIGIARNKRIPLLAVGGMPNHVHLLMGLPANMTIPKQSAKSKPTHLDSLDKRIGSSAGRNLTQSCDSR